MKTLLAIGLALVPALASAAPSGIGAFEPTSALHAPSPLRPRAIVGKDDVTYAKKLKTLFTGESAPDAKDASRNVPPPSKSALESR